ncbi:hypothetical protein [Marinobacter bohaiensis]|uniref:hypothetical protein n=1 Tax=Marinobacter bohaiensis TaxID=2201898 RepID=UPI0013A6CD44|nr:hypothetical protein [Marinobacter bohaiensis]
MNYRFFVNQSNYPVCVVEDSKAFGWFLSFEFVPRRLEELESAIKRAQLGLEDDLEVERNDAVLTFRPDRMVELDFFENENEGGSEITSLSDFQRLFKDWVIFLKSEWKGQLS